MYSRTIRVADFDTCLLIEPRYLGDESVGRERARAAWRWLLQSPAFNAVIIATDPPIAGHSIVAWGASAFVSSSFVEAELAGPHPGLTGRIVASIDAGKPVVLSFEQLRRANTDGDLDLAILCSAIRENDLTKRQLAEAQMLQAAAMIEIHTGYHIRRIVGEPLQDSAIEMCAGSGVWRPCMAGSGLWMVTGQEVNSQFNWPFSKLFQAPAPVLGLREPEQRLLLAALTGLTDVELASELNVHLSTVKKYWESIFECVSVAAPQLFPGSPNPASERTRGKQKRHHVLAYVREHLEELRPYNSATKGNLTVSQ